MITPRNRLFNAEIIYCHSHFIKMSCNPKALRLHILRHTPFQPRLSLKARKEPIHPAPQDNIALRSP